MLDVLERMWAQVGPMFGTEGSRMGGLHQVILPFHLLQAIRDW